MEVAKKRQGVMVEVVLVISRSGTVVDFFLFDDLLCVCGCLRRILSSQYVCMQNFPKFVSFFFWSRVHFLEQEKKKGTGAEKYGGKFVTSNIKTLLKLLQGG